MWKIPNFFSRSKGSPKELIGVSKPGTWHTKDDWGDKTDITINLYLQGISRSWDTTPKSSLNSQEIDFWVKTGKFANPADEQHFEWLLSPREQKKRLLAELIAMDIDK